MMKMGSFSPGWDSKMILLLTPFIRRDVANLPRYIWYHMALIFNDSDMAEVILGALYASQVKDVARKVQGFDQEVWNQHQERIALRGNYLKFTRSKMAGGTRYQKALLDTENRELSFTCGYDALLGIGMKWRQTIKRPREQWGQNLLGKALMSVRERIRADEKV
jgi:ribA/ribD-fused uncharacterized protein